MTEASWTRSQIVQELIRSPHGDIASYEVSVRQALRSDAEFVAHLIAYHHEHGAVRDAKIALPVYTLAETQDTDFLDNALAHLALLSPRDLVRAWQEVYRVRPHGQMWPFKRMVRRYLVNMEIAPRRWDRVAIQFRRDMKSLYKIAHLKPAPRAKRILFERQYPDNSVFATIALLPVMSPEEVGRAIAHYNLPFLTVKGALGKRVWDETLLVGVLTSMTGTEVLNNTKMLKTMGVERFGAARALYEAKLQEAVRPTRGTKPALLKATRAAEALEASGATALAQKVRTVQEQQFATAAGIEGDWAILGDASGSMHREIEYTRHLAAFLAKMVKGLVHVIFFDDNPRYFEATGMTYEQLKTTTAKVQAGGSTSIGCGVKYLLERSLVVDGFAVVTDGGENCAPYFVAEYQKYCAWVEKDVPVYYYAVDLHNHRASFDVRLTSAGIDFTRFDVDGSDYYSLPNLALTMRTNRYGLLDDIYGTPLKTLEAVLPRNLVKGDRYVVTAS